MTNNANVKIFSTFECFESDLNKQGWSGEIYSLLIYGAKTNYKKIGKFKAIFSTTWIARKLKISDRTVRRNLQILKDKGFVDIKRLPPGQDFNRDKIRCDMEYTPLKLPQDLNFETARSSDETARSSDETARSSDETARSSDETARSSAPKTSETVAGVGLQAFSKTHIIKNINKNIIRNTTPLPPSENFPDERANEKSFKESDSSPKPINIILTLSEMFEIFTEAYPKGVHSHKNRNTAFRVFQKIIKDKKISFNDLIARTKKYAETWDKDDLPNRRYIPSLSKWLSEAYYKDFEAQLMPIPEKEINISLDPLIESFLVKTGNQNFSESNCFLGATATPEENRILIFQPTEYFKTKIPYFQMDLQKFFGKEVIIQ